jgi:hypothetical protein
LSDWQKGAINSVTVVFQEAGEALDQTFLCRPIARRVIGNRGQVRMFAAGQSTDQRHQGIEMLFAMALWARLIELHDGLFYGTIPTIRVTHGAAPDWQKSFSRRSIPEMARISV